MLFVKVNGESREVEQITAKGKAIMYVYKGAQLIWEGIRSCFGAGYWRGDKPWIGTDGWKRLKNN